MSYKTETIINRISTINHYEKAVLSSLATFSDAIHEKCNPSIGSIARRAACSVRQTHNIIKRLIRRGLLFIIKSGKACGNSNIYKLNEKGLVELKNLSDPDHKTRYLGEGEEVKIDTKGVCTEIEGVCTACTGGMHSVQTNKIINKISKPSSLQDKPEEEKLIKQSQPQKPKIKPQKRQVPKTPKPEAIPLPTDFRPNEQTVNLIKNSNVPITTSLVRDFFRYNIGAVSTNWHRMFAGFALRSVGKGQQHASAIKQTYQQQNRATT